MCIWNGLVWKYNLDDDDETHNIDQYEQYSPKCRDVKDIKLRSLNLDASDIYDIIIKAWREQSEAAQLQHLFLSKAGSSYFHLNFW